MRCDAWVSVLSWWSYQSPVSHSCGLLSHPNSFWTGMFKLHAKFDAHSLLSLLSHFECDGHTVHMLIQQHLSPPLSITLKSSLFMHAHSRCPLSLAARLYWCHTNHFCYINNGCSFSGLTSYIYCRFLCVWIFWSSGYGQLSSFLYQDPNKVTRWAHLYQTFKLYSSFKHEHSITGGVAVNSRYKLLFVLFVE